MTYRFKVQRSMFKVLRRAGTAMASTSAIFLLFAVAQPTLAADKLIGIHSARVLSQSMPWVAQEAGLFKKYNLDFDLVFIASSPSVTAAMLGGDAEISLGGRTDPRLRPRCF
jgi:ABC-type nitrate/sulfonate/bicarbonate transport system substrate-binding protein